MRTTVAILLALGIGFGLGYVVGGMGIERVEEEFYTSLDNKPDAESRARAGSSESAERSGSLDSTAGRNAHDAPTTRPPERTHEQAAEVEEEAGPDHPDSGDNPSQQPEPRAPSPQNEHAVQNERHALGQEPETSDGQTLRTQIQGEFSRIRVSLRECYELLLQLEPTAADRLVFMLLIESDPDDPAGSLVTLEGIRSDALELDDVSCFAEIAGELQLPPPADGEPYRVSYPVVLTAE